MIENILFLSAMIAIFVIIRWYILNKGDESNPTKGFLGMKDEKSQHSENK